VEEAVNSLKKKPAQFHAADEGPQPAGTILHTDRAGEILRMGYLPLNAALPGPAIGRLTSPHTRRTIISAAWSTSMWKMAREKDRLDRENG